MTTFGKLFLILYTNKTNLGDTQFLYIDLVITTTVAVLMGRTGPWDSLVRERPPGSLVSGHNLLSVGLQILASLAGQMAAVVYLHNQDWYSPVQLEGDEVRLQLVRSRDLIIIISGHFQIGKFSNWTIPKFGYLQFVC